MMELEHRSAKLVAARVGDDVDHRALRAAHFRSEDVRADLDFGNPFNGGAHREKTGAARRVLETIQQHLVGTLGLAVGGKRGALPAGIGTTAAGEAVRGTDVDAWLQPDQLD